jgi:hypothetical protein
MHCNPCFFQPQADRDTKIGGTLMLAGRLSGSHRAVDANLEQFGTH